MMWTHGFWWPGSLFFAAIWGLFWLMLLVFLVKGILRWGYCSAWTREVGTPATTPSAIEIIRQRYARGEIDAATFEQMLEQLLKSEDSNNKL